MVASGVLASFAVVFVGGSASDAHAKRPHGADLTVRSLVAPAAAVRGARFRFVFTVANNGAARARRPKVRAFLSRDKRRSRGDIRLLAAASIPRLAPGAMARRRGTARVPRRTATGKWFLIVCAAAERDANSRNNCRRSLRRTTVWKHAPPPPPQPPRPPPPPPPGGLALQQVDGGLNYYAQFSNPLPTSPSFFPIGVWGAYAQEADNRNKDAAAGLNTYVWAADTGFYPDIRADGRFHVIVSQGGGPVGTETFARMLDDEIDMNQGPGACPGAINSIKAGLPNDGRMRYANYGKGVAIWWRNNWANHTEASARCFVNSQDLTSTDMYWHTDPYETDSPQSGTSWGYGWTMEQQRRFDAADGKITPQWGFVEVVDPGSGLGQITPAEIKGAVWHTLIKGARGIIYFQHDFTPPCDTHHALREVGSDCYGATINAVAALNAQIKSLAPVLNAPFVNGGRTVTGPVEHAVKFSGGNLYVLAAGRSSGSMSFSMPCIGNATATVIGENRTIPVSGGSFNDSFADGNAVHIYRINRGSTCGLS